MDILKKSKRSKRLPGEASAELRAAVDALRLDPVQKFQSEHAKHSTSELERALGLLPLEERKRRGINFRTAEERQQEIAELNGIHASASRERQREEIQDAFMKKAARLNAEALVDLLRDTRSDLASGANYNDKKKAQNRATEQGDRKPEDSERKRGGEREPIKFIRGVLAKYDPHSLSDREGIAHVRKAIRDDVEGAKVIWKHAEGQSVEYWTAEGLTAKVTRASIARSVKGHLKKLRKQGA